MISTFTALIDANVFFGARLTSLVLFLAQTKMFRARWSEQINAEWMASLHAKRGISPENLERRRQLMNASVLDSIVSGYETLIEGLSLPDPDDRHVLAAAIRTRADVILTFNTADFPDEVLKPFGIEVRHPDTFLIDLFGISRDLFIEALRNDFHHYKSPKLAYENYVASLESAGVPETARPVSALRIVAEVP